MKQPPMLVVFDGGRDGFFVGTPDGQIQFCDVRAGAEDVVRFMVKSANGRAAMEKELAKCKLERERLAEKLAAMRETTGKET